MTFDELCALAGNGKPLPRSVLPLERVAYRGLTWLYHAYRRGAFSKDEAAEIIRLGQERNRLKRERDQAVEDLNTLRKRSDWKCEACYYNDHYNRDICTGCEYNNDNNWQWRGVQEENNG